MPARCMLTLLFFTTCLLGGVRVTSEEAGRFETGAESRNVPLYLRASNTMQTMELTATKARVVKQSRFKYFSWVLCTAALAWAGRLASLLRAKKLEARQGLRDAMRKQYDELELVMKDKVELKKQLQCSRKGHQALQEQMSKIEKDKNQLVETLEIRNREICTIKGTLREAQGWQRECLKLDKEVNHLHQAVEERDKVLASMQKNVDESKGWRMEQTALHNQLNELLDMIHANRDEVAGLKLQLQKAEGPKFENDSLKKQINDLHQALDQYAENSKRAKKKSMLWKTRALESEETLQELQSQLANKAYKEERFKACLEACIVEGNWAKKCVREASVGASKLEMEPARHNAVAYRTSLKPG
ncbi:hypothetical protein BSKO_01912 [Bryopsis sp. KO-2023]|nr:hypothetical protein BSKO_01912 [Bryopsis sp. KO-2023]